MQADKCPYVIPYTPLVYTCICATPGESAVRLRFKRPRLGILVLGYRAEGLEFKLGMLAVLFVVLLLLLGMYGDPYFGI